MSTRNTLPERISGRSHKFRLQSNTTIITVGQVRAELDRLARQVRKSIKLWGIYKEKDFRKEEKDCWDSRIAGAQDVLALIREAKR